ncbi:MAG: C45 family peptidase [Jatrophihabitantaceae bacterium]
MLAANPAGASGRLAATLAGYDRLFAACSIGPARVRAVADSARSALAAWAPDLAAEIEAIAAAAGEPAWRLYALNARTEVLAAVDRPAAGRDCSTIAGPGLGAQTWDWHVELAGCWQLLGQATATIPFVTLTEIGILAKIGVNAAGVGLLFNILGHRADTGLGGVPVHALARRVLDSATDVESAVAIIAGAPLAASSCFTVLDERRAVCLEASPAGVRELAANQAGWLAHTNHFLDPVLATADLRVGAEFDTEPRLALLRHRLDQVQPQSPDELRQLLCAHDGDGAPVCCHAPAGGPLGTRWQTLATVAVLPAERSLRVLAGGPCGPTDWTISWPPGTKTPELGNQGC